MFFTFPVIRKGKHLFCIYLCKTINYLAINYLTFEIVYAVVHWCITHCKSSWFQDEEIVQYRARELALITQKCWFCHLTKLTILEALSIHLALIEINIQLSNRCTTCPRILHLTWGIIFQDKGSHKPSYVQKSPALLFLSL